MNHSLTKPRRAGGARTKYGRETHQAIVAAVEAGLPITVAAQVAGLSFQSLCDYRRRHPQLDADIKQALARGIQERLNVVLKATESQDENVRLRAACWWLSHSPESARYFSESSRVEVTGDGFNNQIAVLVWPHMVSKEDENSNDHPAIAALDAG